MTPRILIGSWLQIVLFLTLTTPLAAQSGSLQFNTELAGDLYVDGELFGTVKRGDSYVIPDIPKGCRAVEIRGSENWKQMVKLSGESATVSFEEKKAEEGAYPTDVDTCEPDPVYTIVAKEPELIGGMDSLYQVLRYPTMALRAGIEGTVLLEFIVNKDGTISDAKVKHGIGGGCDEAALKALRQMSFNPGMSGKPVRVRTTLPVKFRMQN